MLRSNTKPEFLCIVLSMQPCRLSRDVQDRHSLTPWSDLLDQSIAHKTEISLVIISYQSLNILYIDEFDKVLIVSIHTFISVKKHWVLQKMLDQSKLWLLVLLQFTIVSTLIVTTIYSCNNNSLQLMNYYNCNCYNYYSYSQYWWLSLQFWSLTFYKYGAFSQYVAKFDKNN